MTARKRIALLVGQPEESYQKQFIEGFLEKAFAYNYDVCVFDMYQKQQESGLRKLGDASIFSMIRYDLFDIFVVLAETLQPLGAAEEVERKLKKKYSGPVILVDKESFFFQSVMSKHYLPAKKIISHLIDVHGYKDIAYVGGEEWCLKTKQQIQGFTDCMKEHELEIRSNRVFNCDMSYAGGEYVAEELLKDKKNMPEAVACANDYMAIGLSKALTKSGIRVPEDVAVVGYDSMEEGKTSPKPLTSTIIHVGTFGKYIADSVNAIINGQSISAYEADAELFVGSSCGCHNESLTPTISVRDCWDTEESGAGYYSLSNLLMHDLMLQEDFSGLISTIFSYVHQVRSFDSFHLCLNEWWSDIEQTMPTEDDRRTYSAQMIHIMQCGPDDDSQDRVDFEDVFDTDSMLPDMYEKRNKPAAYIFTPILFEEQCFGYAALSYGDNPKVYDKVYRLWLRNISQGLEYFRRIQELKFSNHAAEMRVLRDSLTGFYNYNGLLDQAGTVVDNTSGQNPYTTIMVVDISGLSSINNDFGRDEGNRAIVKLARFLEDCNVDGITGYLGNGEFAVIAYTKEQDRIKIHEIRDHLMNNLEQFNSREGSPYGIYIYTGSNTEKVTNREDLAQLISATVSRKNGNKVAEKKLESQQELTPKELDEAKRIREVLDENLFSYDFQPIVNARTGEIYAYEALMRAETKPPIPPVKVLKYARYLGRLYDVEKATFLNVLKYIEDNEDLFGGRKVFINSIPGNNLEGDDKKAVQIQMNKRSGMLVVELTEQTELDDDELAAMKIEYEKNDIQTAVDDYGTGYSNITNLLRYMPNYVKIDRMLLNEIQNSPQKQHFVRDIIEFAHDNGIMALAEGVETAQELKEVIYLDADLVQGFYTAMPAPTPVDTISKEVKDEILRYNHAEQMKKKSRIYIAGRERRVSLVNLMARKYIGIQVSGETKHKDVIISGVPGFRAKMDLQVMDGFSGKIVLDHVILCGKKNRPCIRIGENCDVTLVLEGDNELQTGGICVPESSRLTLQGNGNLAINGNPICNYGIGNGVDSRNGAISLEQDGTLDIRLEGDKLVGIGSGQGGDINICKGKYIFRMKGKESVAIGSLYAACELAAEQFDIECYMTSEDGVVIGSLEGNTDVNIHNVLARFSLQGKNVVGIGSIKGKNNYAKLKHANINIDLRGKKVCGIGSLKGTSKSDMEYIALFIRAEGKDAIAIGCMDKSGIINITEYDVNTAVISDRDDHFGAHKEAISLTKGRNHFEHNGELRTYS